MCNFVLFCFKTHSEILMCSRNLFQLKSWRRKSKSLINARSRGWSSRGQGVGLPGVPGFISWFWQANTQKNLPISPQPSPVLEPGQEEIARRIALDWKQLQTSFTVVKLRLKADFPLRLPGQEPSWPRQAQLGIKQRQLNPGLIQTPQPTDNSTQVSKINNN